MVFEVVAVRPGIMTLAKCLGWEKEIIEKMLPFLLPGEYDDVFEAFHSRRVNWRKSPHFSQF